MTKKKKKQKKQKKFNKANLLQSVLNIFSMNAGKTFNYKQIAKRLYVVDTGEKILISEVLRELAKGDFITEIYKGKYKLKSKGGYIEGIVDVTTKGFAYIISDEVGEDVFVSQKNLNHALNGDKVKVYLYARKQGKQIQGEVVEVIERSITNIVGIIQQTEAYAFLIPDSRKVPYELFIPPEEAKKAEHGQKVIAKIKEWAKGAKNPVGEIIEVLGFAGENETEMHAILAEFELPSKFPEDVERMAELIDTTISKEEIKKRKDYRHIPTLTIDPEDAKDFDDALSLQKLENGNYKIGVHIADVTHYVKPGSIIDNEAVFRATSVYLVDRVVPMLPEKLSNMVCSLRPNEDKLCYSAVFELDEEANIVKEWFGRTVINSNRRFTYADAQMVIDTGEGDASTSLSTSMAKEVLVLNELALKLRSRRFGNGSFAFERDETKFKLDDEGKPLGVYYKIMQDSNHLIEEYMLLANKQVARFIGAPKERNQKKTFVYRIHDKPNPEKLQKFSSFIQHFGHRVNLKNKKNIASSINELMKKIKGNPEQNVIETLAIRSMAKAEYSTKNIGHYGLAFSHYTHFTSPIRRYPDMIVHRLLDGYLSGEKSANADKFDQLCKHSSEMEHRASQAERASTKYKMVEYMKDRVGQEFEGVISGVAEWGIYVEEVESKCEGLIPIRDMKDDFYIYDEENYCIIGRHSRKQYQLGDTLRFKLVSANLMKRQLNYRLVD